MQGKVEPLPEPPLRIASEVELRRCLRDVMSLLALPALLGGEEPHALVELLADAVERLLPIDACHVHVPLRLSEPPVESLRVAGRPVDLPAPDWAEFTCLDGIGLAPEAATAWVATPLGAARVVRLTMNYAGRAGIISVASTDPEFPGPVDAVVLRAAASLAGSALSTASALYEREAALRAKDEFLAMLGHELRNPLAPIVTVMAIMKLRGGGTLSREHQVIERQVAHLTALVDDLLDIARVTRGKVDIRTEDVETAEFVARAVEMTRPLLEKHRHTLVVDVPAAGLPVRVDIRRMAQVIGNLLINAVKYSPDEERIEITASREGTTVRIGVRDNGIGIDGQLLPRVFDMFYQAHASQDRSGLGIGLALVKSLVALHGGSVAAYSPGVGRGSEFVVTLPLAAALRPPRLAPPAESAAAPVVPQRVLVVDDNTDAAVAVQQLLDAVGHHAMVAHDAAAALRLCEQLVPSVAVLDIGLPGVDGYQLAQMIRLQMGARAPRLLALSGYGLSADAQRSEEAGFEVHLVKPVDVERLLAAVAGNGTPAKS